MKVGDQVKIISKSRGNTFFDSRFQRHLQNSTKNIINYVDGVQVNVSLFTIDEGEQRWDFLVEDLVLVTDNPTYEVY